MDLFWSSGLDLCRADQEQQASQQDVLIFCHPSHPSLPSLIYPGGKGKLIFGLQKPKRLYMFVSNCLDSKNKWPPQNTSEEVLAWPHASNREHFQTSNQVKKAQASL